MPASAFPLARLQRWMQAVIEAPGGIDDAVAAPAARRELAPRDIGRLVLPSATLAPIERVGIYQAMYFLRMRDALRSDYPAVAALLGEDGFARAVLGYTRRHPSRSYTLNRLGDRFPRWLAGARWLPRRAFTAELARFELLLTQAFDAEETAPLAPDAIERVPAAAWAGARLEPVASLRLGAFRWPVATLSDAVSAERPLRVPRPHRTCYALYRRDWVVRRLELEPAAFALLSRLADGRPLGRAITATLRRHPRAEKRLFDWFRDWTQVGLFRAIRTATGAGRG